ncbi:cyclic diguanylate phosphodiesterase (EAL) domain protein [Leptospira interrogans serovar Icterohaemorrhagiae str. Verdun HP]|nr:cyclic diguanylate phosphodiesterase (EAL) domain protein [Leptospira interrogans serovar Icterohaemorrhagiae str. Verdun HP]
MALEILTKFENLSIVDSSNLKISSTQNYDGEILPQLTEILKTGDFHTEYQPILSLETGKIYAYEALARFRIKEKIFVRSLYLTNFIKIRIYSLNLKKN